MRQPGLFLCLLAAIATGCADGGRPLEPRTDPRLRDRVVELGFRPDMIVDQGSTFLVEGDIVISKRDLEAGGVPAGHASGVRQAPGGPSHQYISDRTVSYAGFPQRPIHVHIAGAIRNDHPEWTRAVREAMTQWNQLGGFGLRFVETATESASDILVTSYRYEIDEVAKSGWPRGGTPGAYLWINLGYRGGTGPGGLPVYESKLFHMVHELGHTIGFRHTNYVLLGEFRGDSVGAHLVPNTPRADSLSVMNAGPTRRTWRGFSAADRIAARVVYTGSVRIAASIQNGHPAVTWSAEDGAYEYRIFRASGYPFAITEQVGATSGTAFTDTSVSAAVARECQPAEFASYVYYVLAYFPEGTVTRRAAPGVCVY